MIPVPITWAAIACTFCALVGGLGGWKLAHNITDAQEGREASHAAILSDLQRIGSAGVDRTYVERLEAVQPPPVTVIRDRIIRAACSVQRADSSESVPASDSEKPVDAPITADADAGLVDGIAADAEACVRNRIQLDELQALILVNTKKEKPDVRK